MTVPGRCGNGYRDHRPPTIDRMRVVRSLLEAGLPVRLIKEALPHLTDRPAAEAELTCAEFLHEVANYRDRLADRIARYTPSTRRWTPSCARRDDPVDGHDLALTLV